MFDLEWLLWVQTVFLGFVAAALVALVYLAFLFMKERRRR